jgi:Vanillate O-demethylase oxygenase C-terminal domain
MIFGSLPMSADLPPQRSPGAPPRVPHVGTYRRELPVSVERLYENAIDWAHLPYLHRSTFARVECIEAGEWGFRARVWQRFREDQRPFLIEVRLDRECRRWITRTLDGPGAGAEVWTHAFAAGERRTDIVVDFFVPGATAERAERLREFYVDLYARLYDEDVRSGSTRPGAAALVSSGSGARSAGLPTCARGFRSSSRSADAVSACSSSTARSSRIQRYVRTCSARWSAASF